MVAGQDTAADAMIRYAGASNATADGKVFKGYKPLTTESAVASAPDIVLIPRENLKAIGGVERLLASPGLLLTPAARNKRVVAEMDSLLLVVMTLICAALGATLWPDALRVAGIYAPMLAAIGLLIYVASDDQLRTLTFWNLGNLASAQWSLLGVAMPVVIFSIAALHSPGMRPGPACGAARRATVRRRADAGGGPDRTHCSRAGRNAAGHSHRVAWRPVLHGVTVATAWSTGFIHEMV